MSLTVNKPKVLIIGDSFIRRLGDWMERINSDFSGSVDTKLHGVSGRRVQTLQTFTFMLWLNTNQILSSYK